MDNRRGSFLSRKPNNGGLDQPPSSSPVWAVDVATTPVSLAAKKPSKTRKQRQHANRSSAYCQANKGELQAKRRARYKALLSPAEKLEVAWQAAARPHAPRRALNTPMQQRRTVLASVFCEWSNLDEVLRIYCAAAVMTELTGQSNVVDHAVPHRAR
ncbi:hypothetical protein [Pseudorhodoferax sp.]|uniref:hypothetical protein n=1 Tax=Pseudorhodoferax sp. TaxID=1993553 RepID=UPI002DD65963|nr:hypothetical protein [Pseudorhodoferax sp.]